MAIFTETTKNQRINGRHLRYNESAYIGAQQWPK